MRQHLIGIVFAGALAAAIAAPAHGQEQNLETRLLLANQTCMEKGADPGGSSNQAIADICQSALNAMGDIYLKASPSKHEENVYRTLFAMAKLAVGSSYGKIDGVRSQRMCTQAEQAWQMLAPITPDQSPADRAAIMRDTVSKTRQIVGICRKDFAKPYLAPDL